MKVSVYKQLTKTILIEAMDKDTPAVVFDMAFKEYSVTGFSMKQGGKLMVDLDDATSVPVGNLFVLDRTMTFGK